MANLNNELGEAPDKSWYLAVIDMLIIMTVFAIIIYTYAMNSAMLLKIIVALLLIFVGIGYAISRHRSPIHVDIPKEKITKLVLLDDEGESLKEWYIQGAISLVIGKSSTENEVDIDLTDVEYHSLISKEHSVLNYSNGSWYLEDNDSDSGVGVRKSGKRVTERVEIDEPYEIDSGDIIYIANTRLLVK